MQVSKSSDQELIQMYLGGSENAFSELLDRHQKKIYTAIYLFVKDRDLAEDLFQEVFIKIIDTLRKGSYNHEGKFSQWAARIAYNMCVDHFRRNKRRTKVNTSEDFDIFDVLELPDENREDQIIMSETHSHLRKLVDMSFKEISALTRVSINTALGRMRYALINIRKMMEEKSIVLQ